MSQLFMEDRVRLGAGLPVECHQSLSTTWQIKKYKGDRCIPHNLLDVLDVKGNSIVNGGIDIIWRNLVAGGTPPLSSGSAYIGVGNSSTPTVATMTDLQGTNTRSVTTSLTTLQFNARSHLLQWTATFGNGSGEFDWNEIGIFDASSGGRMFNRKVQYLGTKVANQSWAVTASVGVNQNPYFQSFASDRFEDTAGINVTDHISKMGAQWFGTTLTSVTTPIILSSGRGVYFNRNVTSGTALAYIVAYNDPLTANYIVDADVAYTGTCPNARVGVLARTDRDTANLYQFYHRRNNNTWNIDYRTPSSGGLVNIGSASGYVLTPDVVYNLRAIVNGSALSLYQNGSLVLTVVDTHITSAYYAGFTLGNGADGQYDSSNCAKILRFNASNIWQP